MDVGAQARIVGEIVARIVRVVVENDVIRVPNPAVGIAQVAGGDGKVETVKEESGRAATAEAIHVRGAELAGKVSVLPGVIQMKGASAIVVADPAAIVMDVRSFRVTTGITETVGLLCALRCAAMIVVLFRPVLGNEASADVSSAGGSWVLSSTSVLFAASTMLAAMLRE